MNYQRIYDQFIADRRNKEAALIESGEYKERHHIIPRSMGGSDDAENLICLTAGDHFFAHLCLAKSYGGNQWAAFWAMAKFVVGKRSLLPAIRYRRFIDEARKHKSELMKSNNPSHRLEVRLMRAKQMKDNNPIHNIDRSGENNPMYGKQLVGEKNGMYGRKHSDEWKDRQSIAVKNRYKDPDYAIKMKIHAKENGRKHRGFKHTDESRRKMSIAAKKRSNAHKCRTVRNIDTGEVFTSIKLACISYKCHDIGAVCRGKKKTAGGYRWAYVD